MQLEGEVLGDGQRDARGQDPLDHRVVGGVEQQQQLTRGRTLLEDRSHRVRVGVGQAHRGEHDTERLVARG